MKYQTIYADPPWKTTAGPKPAGYTLVDGKQVWRHVSNATRPLAYQTMTIEEICSLPVSDLADDNAHLYIWTTNGYLPDVFKVIEAWGFNYSTTLVWSKNGGGLGGAFKITTEFLVFARRGNLKTNHTIRNTWFNVKRDYENGYPKHSKKPFFFRHLIESVSPGPYLELFARNRSAGWDVFGNEVEDSIKLLAG